MTVQATVLAADNLSAFGSDPWWLVIITRAVVRWFKMERAMRLSQGLPLSSSIPAVAIAVALLGVASGVAVLVAS